MSGSRSSRKVTVEGTYNAADTSTNRKSVFDRLGPGTTTTERSHSRREEYKEVVVEKCRNWVKDKHCPYGRTCRYDHGSASSKMKLIRSIVSKNEDSSSSSERKSEVKLKRGPSPEEIDQFAGKPAKRMKPESIKVTKESLHQELKESRGYRRPKDDTKTSTKRQEVDADQSEWNLPSISDSDEGQQGNELDWETRGALNQARQKELEKRRKDLRRKIATIDDSDDPVVTISNMPLVEHPSPPFQDEEIKIEKKKKSKSDKSKKKWKKKSHKNDESFDGNANESMDKRKKTKKKKKHGTDSDHERIQSDLSHRKSHFEGAVFQQDLYRESKRHGDFLPPVDRTRPGHRYEADSYHYDKQSRSQMESRLFEKERMNAPQYEMKSRQLQAEESIERDTRQLEQKKSSKYDGDYHGEEYRQFERAPQLEKENRQVRNASVGQYEKDAKSLQSDRKTQIEKSRQTHMEHDSKSGSFSSKRLSWSSQQHEENTALTYEKQSGSIGFGKNRRLLGDEKEIRGSHHEREAKSPSPVGRSPTFEKRSTTKDWEGLSSQVRARSPEKKQRHYQHEPFRIGEQIPLSHGNERFHESQTKEAKRKKETQQNNLSFENRQKDEEIEKLKRQKNLNEKATSLLKEKHKKVGKLKEFASVVRAPITNVKIQKPKLSDEEGKKISPRIQSPELTQLPLSFEKDLPTSGNKSTFLSEKQIKKSAHVKSKQPGSTRSVKSSSGAKHLPLQIQNENITESSENDSSSSTDESESEDETNRGNVSKKTAKIKESKKKESDSELNNKQRTNKNTLATRNVSANVNSRDVSKQSRNDVAKRPTEEKGRKERREDDKYHRGENAQDVRRTRIEDPRGSKNVRDARDPRESRDYRDFSRMQFRDNRERERFRDFDERERHPLDMRREYRDAPPDFANDWSRDRYDGYDTREYDRRGDNRGIPVDYERHFDGDRLHPDRGGRYRGMEEGSWHDRRGYRDTDRYHEGRGDRYQDEPKPISKSKRSRNSPQTNRGERKGHHRKRIAGGNPDDSEEWDYEEGNSPDQQTTSRKRGKDSPIRSPRSDYVKRKKASTPEKKISESSAAKNADIVMDKHPVVKEGDIDGKKPKKDKDKEKGKKNRKTKLDDENTKSDKTVSPDEKQYRETSNNKEGKKSKSEEPTDKNSSDIDDDPPPLPIDDAEKNENASVLLTRQNAHEQVVNNLDESKAEIDLNQEGIAAKFDDNEKAEDKEIDKVQNDDENGAYDFISDDEWEPMTVTSNEDNKETGKTQTLDMADVDWSVLETNTEKVSEPGDYIKRFSAGNIFSRIGLSSALAGPTLSKLVQEKCAQDAPDKGMKSLLLKTDKKKLRLGGLIAAEARRLKEREGVVSDIGPCRRALCARRDFFIRKKLRKLATMKLGTKLLLDNTTMEPVDSELFSLSVSIFKRGIITTDVTKEDILQNVETCT